MKPAFFFALHSFLFIGPTLGQGVIEVLNANGLNAFAAELSTYPDLIAQILGRNDVTVFAPTNAAIEGLPPTKTYKNHTLSRRQTTDPNAEASTSAQLGKQPPKPDTVTKKRQISGAVDLPISNYMTIYSFLENPQFVNLGVNQPARFISNEAARPDGQGLAFLEVVTGNGDVVSQVQGPFKFNRGIIYGVNSRFTLPQLFTTTMQAVGSATPFFNAVIAANLLDKCENSTGITIFAPIGEIGSGLSPNAHIISNFLGYTPNLLPGHNYTADSGALINITFGPTGDRLVNGKRLVRPNVVMKNGVIHFIDSPLDGSLPAPNTTSSSAPPVQTFTSAAADTVKIPLGIAVFTGTIAALVLHGIF
ncbi:hypothetical protein BDD12DRAFT_888887 [Trichophaea hybrida]|nr:hypothetical protein BDD12DRAFT_888887 [Trichophaea hybrida]